MSHASAFESAMSVSRKHEPEMLEFLEQVGAIDVRLASDSKTQFAGIDLHAAWLLGGPTAPLAAIEWKADEADTGNVFLETWSNRGDGRPGWLATSECHSMLYLRVAAKRMHVIGMESLRRWADGNLARWVEVRTRCEQRNDTWGVPVPASVLARELGPDFATWLRHDVTWRPMLKPLAEHLAACDPCAAGRSCEARDRLEAKQAEIRESWAKHRDAGSPSDAH